jgi:pimeloyl-ACP methyl ester carboxylesterase
MSTKPSLLLLHGVTMSARAWDTVAPLLERNYDLLVPTAAGHRGGRRLDHASIEALTDVTEQLLDDRGLDTVHIAGNSMGGWMGIELARRGRARSVCALSPAGFWEPDADPGKSRATLIRTKKLADATSSLMPPLMRFGFVRQLAMRDIALRGKQMTHQQAAASFEDLVGCDAAHDLLNTRESVAPFAEMPCPVTVAWSSGDRIFPPRHFVPAARQRLPGAHFVTLAHVGHVPMIDDAALVAKTIEESIVGR